MDPATLGAFVELCGPARWRERLSRLKPSGATTTRVFKQHLQYHAIELVIDRLQQTRPRSLTKAEQHILTYALDAVALHAVLPPAAQARLRADLAACLDDGCCLVPVFHILRTASLQRSRGFEVSFARFLDQAPFDLLIRRGGAEAEIACDTMSAEEGRSVHRDAWCRLMDRVDPDLQTWLRAHPGRYLLKLTFPLGLNSDERLLPALHDRITQMLQTQRRTDADAAVVLRLDPLMLAAAQADELGLMPRLRREFGPEAHLAVTASGNGLFVTAGRAGQQNEVATAMRRRMANVSLARLTGTRPGILAMFVEDTDRVEWRLLRERLELEGETRQFLTNPDARTVVAVTCSSRLELFGLGEPDAAPDGELRFRNPAHPAAKQADLAPAVLSSV